MLTAAAMAAAVVSALALPPWAGAAETLIVKASDESVTSSTTLQDDDELTATTISGTAYELEAFLIYASPAGAGTPDFKVAIGEDSTRRGALHGVGLQTTDGIADTAVWPDLTGTGWGTAATDRALHLTGWFVGNGGSLKIQWAQNTSNGNPTIVRAGSTLRLRSPDHTGGGGGGSVAWDDVTDKPTFSADWLTDVDTTGAIDGAVLKYDEAGGVWQVATDDAGGGGSSGPVTLSAGDRERLDLNWYGVWAIVGLLLCLMIAPLLLRLLDVRHGMGGRFERG